MIARNIRTIIFSVSSSNLSWRYSCGKHLRICSFCDFYIEEVFIIFEKDIVFWLVFFNQVIFEYQRLYFCICNDILNILNLLEHLFFGKIEFLLTRKITIYPRFQILRFPHIYNLSFFIEVLIYPRSMREGSKNMLNRVHYEFLSYKIL